MGGGRIHHKRGEKSIMVYGYSVAFGAADHATTVKLLRADKEFEDYSIAFKNEGY